MAKRTNSGLRFEVRSSHKTVWVNDELVCIGRFDRFGGIDIHQNAAGQRENQSQCLDCEKGPADLGMWERFRTGMLQHHGVEVASDLMVF